jgi:hypothetical protein
MADTSKEVSSCDRRRTSRISRAFNSTLVAMAAPSAHPFQPVSKQFGFVKYTIPLRRPCYPGLEVSENEGEAHGSAGKAQPEATPVSADRVLARCLAKVSQRPLQSQQTAAGEVSGKAQPEATPVSTDRVLARCVARVSRGRYSLSRPLLAMATPGGCATPVLHLSH